MNRLDADLRRHLFALADALQPGEVAGAFPLYVRLIHEATSLRGPCSNGADAEEVAEFCRMIALEFGSVPTAAR